MLENVDICFFYINALSCCGLDKKVQTPQAFLKVQIIHTKVCIIRKLLIKAYFSLKKNCITMELFCVTSLISHNPFILPFCEA